MALPTAKEINVRDSLDERCACEHFLGKTVEEAELLFRENALFYQEDLMFMGPVAFCYYVPAYIRYLKSEHSKDDSDAVNCFQGLLQFIFEHQPSFLPACARELAEACRYVVSDYEKFSVNVEIYGDLQKQFEMLAGKLETLPLT